MCNGEGDWDLERIGKWVNVEGVKLIKAILPPRQSIEKDSVRWGNNLQGKYCVAEMYHLMKEEQSLWKEI